MPGKVVRRRGARHRRPKTRLKLPSDVSFFGMNRSKRAIGWVQGRFLHLALLVLLVLTFNHLLTSPDFQVSVARVYGNRLVSAEAVVEAASLPRGSILLVDGTRIRESILTLQQIKDARVSTQFPNQVQIHVTERTPACIWKVKDTLYLASEDGVLLGTSESTSQAIFVVDLDGRPRTIGDRVDKEAVATASRLAVMLPRQAGLAPKYYEYSATEGIVVPTDFAGRVIFGDSENLESKVATFKAISDRIRLDGLKVHIVDLRFEGRPYLR